MPIFAAIQQHFVLNPKLLCINDSADTIEDEKAVSGIVRTLLWKSLLFQMVFEENNTTTCYVICPTLA